MPPNSTLLQLWSPFPEAAPSMLQPHWPPSPSSGLAARQQQQWERQRVQMIPHLDIQVRYGHSRVHVIMIITSYRIQHFSVYRIYSQLSLYFFYSAILKVGIINFILQKSKWGSERLINLLKIPLWTNIRPKIGIHIFDLQEQYSLHSIPSSILEKQISTPLPSPTQ